MEPFRNPVLPADQRVKDLLQRMTINEKVGQLNQRLYGFKIYKRDGAHITLTPEFESELTRWGGLGVLYGLFRADPWTERTLETGIPASLSKKTYNLVQKRVIDSSRFGIPALMSTESPHGHQALNGYLLPVCLAMGATFAPELVRSAFSVVGRQLKEQGVDLALISVLDVLRDPRWGRSEECFSEDPLLCSVMADAAVTGCMEQGVDVVAKHFCAQGETTGGLNTSPASIGLRELNEIHLPPAKAAVQAGVKGIMAAYNEIDGIPCHANPELLRDILRNELGFEGVVMADGAAVDRLDLITGGAIASGALALKSGVDVSLWDEGFTKLEEAVDRGLVDETLLDEAAARVLKLKFQRGLFEHPYLDESISGSKFTIDEYPQSHELARQSVVLLKNENNLLPLSNSIRKIAVIGPAADDIYTQLGDYTPPIEPGHGITLWKGLKQLAPYGIELCRADGCGIRDGTQEGINEAVALAKSSDVVILALGGSSSRFAGETKFDLNGAMIHDGEVYMDCGEGVDTAELSLPGRQNELAKAVYAAKIPVITVITAGRPYAITSIDNETNALLYAFYPGPWGGKALAEIVFGTVNPSGRLPVSLPRSVGQLPCCYNRKASNTELRYCEMPNTPLFSFGYGLSYTTYKVDSVKTESGNEPTVKVSFRISNSGGCGGYAVPMLYIRWLRGDTTPREKELKAFKKIWLETGQHSDVIFELDKKMLSRLNADMKSIPGKGHILLTLIEGSTEHWRGEVEVSC